MDFVLGKEHLLQVFADFVQAIFELVDTVPLLILRSDMDLLALPQ